MREKREHKKWEWYAAIKPGLLCSFLYPLPFRWPLGFVSFDPEKEARLWRSLMAHSVLLRSAAPLIERSRDVLASVFPIRFCFSLFVLYRSPFLFCYLIFVVEAICDFLHVQVPSIRYSYSAQTRTNFLGSGLTSLRRFSSRLSSDHQSHCCRHKQSEVRLC